MEAISYSTARAHLAGTMNKVRENHEPVVITRRGEEETTFLLRSPANAQRWRSRTRSTAVRLINEIRRDPFAGIGKPEPLRHALAGYWPRRIDAKHRIVYCISCRQRGLSGFVRSVSVQLVQN